MDEVASLRNAEALTSSGLSGFAAQDHVAPLSAVFDSASIAIGGTGEFWMRLPAAMAGTLAAGATYVVSRRILGDPGIAFGAGLFAAVAPFAVWFGQEARMYSLLLLIANAYVWACWGLIDGNIRRWDWALMALTAGLGLWTHHYMALLITAFGVFILARRGFRNRSLWTWAATQAVALAAFVPWLVLTGGQGNATGFEKSGQLFWLPYTLFSDVAGMSLGPSTRDLRLSGTAQVIMQNAPSIALVSAVLAAIAVAGVPVLWRRSRAAAAWILCWGLLPPTLAIALTFVADVSYNSRYAITSFPAVAILVGAAGSRLTTVWSARVAVALTACVVAWSLSNWYTDPHYAKDDLRSPAVTLAQQMGPNDVLVVDNMHALPSLEYYGWRCRPSDVVVSSPEGTKAAARDLSTHMEPRTTWLLVFRPWELDPQGSLLAALGEGRGVVAGAWPGSTLIRYAGSGPVSAASGLTVGCLD
ncbi:glycosyltransferase family 39 protein [Sinomonas sp. P10A9]|uniref:Glycosyltransferase family 39 protein n=1 Tax=Sinomonas puerhi TaxID=3238584 RepID=A0AB39L8A0_9MICC